MRIFGLPKAFYHIARHPPVALSLEGQERAHRAHPSWEGRSSILPRKDEGELEITPLNQALQAWEHTYPSREGPSGPIRLRRELSRTALDGRTPWEYLKECHPDLTPLP